MEDGNGNEIDLNDEVILLKKQNGLDFNKKYVVVSISDKVIEISSLDQKQTTLIKAKDVLIVQKGTK